MYSEMWLTLHIICIAVFVTQYSHGSYISNTDNIKANLKVSRDNNIIRRPGGDIGDNLRRLEDDILVKQSTRPCPCADKTLCNRIKGRAKREVYMFGGKDVGEWKSYDWDVMTSIAEHNGHSDERICLAHAHGVRYIKLVLYPKSKLTDAEYRRMWVGWQISNVTYYFMDGVNVDYEAGVPVGRYDMRQGLTDLVQELSGRLRTIYPDTQITADFGSTPWDFYDYKAITDVCDFIFLMDYDENGGMWFATANSNYTKTLHGILQYIKMGIDPNKIVLGVPWYGYVYSCFDFNTTNHRCYTRKAYPLGYSDIVQKLLPKSSGRQWDEQAKSPFIDIKDPQTGNMTQVWYDDPESIGLKVSLADELGLRGVGVWQASGLNATDYKRSQEMWKTLL